MPKQKSMPMKMDRAHTNSRAELMMCSGVMSSGRVSPKCTIMRMAWTKGVKKSWPCGLNSVDLHLHIASPFSQVKSSAQRLAQLWQLYNVLLH